MLAPGDKDLGTCNVEGAVIVRFRLGADDPEVCAGVGLGQIHGAGPDTGIHVRQVLFFQLITSVGVQREAGAGRKHGGQPECHVGALHHFLELRDEGLGHAHAAKVRVAAKTVPAAFNDGLVRFLEALRRRYLTIVPFAALLITFAIQGRKYTTADLAGFFKNGVRRFRVHMLGNLGQ